MPAVKPVPDTFASDYQTMSIGGLCEKYGSAPGTIRSWAKKVGLPLKRTKVSFKPGETVGSWTVLEKLSANRCGSMRWRVRCKCGKEKIKVTAHILASATSNAGCGCVRNTGYGQIPGKYWKSVLQKARDRGIAVSVSIQEAWDQFHRQSGKCALTGIDLTFGFGQTASLDRIDSTLPYIGSNIQWVHKHINWMKNRFTTDQFIAYCRSVVNHFESKA